MGVESSITQNFDVVGSRKEPSRRSGEIREERRRAASKDRRNGPTGESTPSEGKRAARKLENNRFSHCIEW